MLSNFNLISTLNTINTRKKCLVVTLNAHSYRLMQIDEDYKQSILNSSYVLPDGIAIVHFLRSQGISTPKISGSQLFFHEMERMNKTAGKVFFLGSSDEVLSRIRKQASLEFPHVQVGLYSPPFKAEFSERDNLAMIKLVNIFKPDVLFIGMTAPKQEKWACQHFEQLDAMHICCIGAVFDFYAGTVKRPPQWMINIGFEWFGRLIKEPKRMWRRYLISSPVIYLDLFKSLVKTLFIAK